MITEDFLVETFCYANITLRSWNRAYCFLDDLGRRSGTQESRLGDEDDVGGLIVGTTNFLLFFGFGVNSIAEREAGIDFLPLLLGESSVSVNGSDGELAMLSSISPIAVSV